MSVEAHLTTGQLRVAHGKTYMNIYTDLPEALGVWICANATTGPAALLRDRSVESFVSFIQFEEEAWLGFYLQEHPNMEVLWRTTPPAPAETTERGEG